MRVADRHGRGDLRGNQSARHAESKQLAYIRLHGTFWTQSPVHTEEIVKDYSPKTGKDYEI